MWRDVDTVVAKGTEIKSSGGTLWIISSRLYHWRGPRKTLGSKETSRRRHRHWRILWQDVCGVKGLKQRKAKFR
jgi:hypothetical protein